MLTTDPTDFITLPWMERSDLRPSYEAEALAETVMDRLLANFKTVRASAIPAPVGSTPMRPRHENPHRFAKSVGC